MMQTYGSQNVRRENEKIPDTNGAPDNGALRRGLSVTTIEGERVTLGGQGAVTALYFMAGW